MENIQACRYRNTTPKHIIKTILIFISVLSCTNAVSQTTTNTSKNKPNREIKGTLLDLNKKTALPYANIIILHKNKGTITNEKGQFSLNLNTLSINDTLSFQYIGYKTKNLIINKIDSIFTVYLEKDTYNLDEIFVFSNNLNPKTIVKKVLENKNTNYKTEFIKSQTFIRKRFVSDIKKINIKFKKSSFPQLSKEKVGIIEKNYLNTQFHLQIFWEIYIFQIVK